MEPNYRESCREGYFTGERDESRQHPQHQMTHFTHQLPYHSNLVSSLQQPAIVLEQSDVQRNREDFTSNHANPSMLRSIYSGSGSVLPSPNILLQSTNHFTSNNQHPQQQQHQQQQQQQLSRLQPTSRSHFSSPGPAHLAASVLTEEPAVAHHPNPAPGVERPEPSRDSLGATMNEPLELITHRQHQAIKTAVLKDKEVVPPKLPNPILHPKHLNLLPQLQPKSLLPPPRSRDNVRRKSSAQLPDFLSFKYLRHEKENIVGVVAKDKVEEGIEFGPYNGNFLDEEIGSTKESTWELCTGGKVFLYVDGKKKDQLIWMSYVQCARNEEEQNLEACQYYGQIYFRTTKCIEPGSELRVFYSKEYSESVGFKTTLKDLNYNEEEGNFQCNSCENQFPTAKRMLRHIKFDHDHDANDDLRPVIIWKVKCKTECAKPEDIPSSGYRNIEMESIKGSSQVYSPRQFICTVCGKKFPTEGRLEAHAMFHEFSEEHTCLLCGEKQRNSKALTKHMAKHESCPHKCRKCDKSYKTQKSLLRHNREVHVLGRKNACRICSIVFVKESECLKHEQTHKEYSKDDAVPDTVWKKKKYRKSQKIEPAPGMSTEVPGEVKTISESNVGARAAPRKKAFKGKPAPEEPKDMLGKTLTYYNRPRPYKCRHCPRRYRSRMAAYEHEKETHEGKGSFKCNLCPRVFMKESNFFQHYQCHEQNRLYRCSLCPRTFASDSALTNHQGEHTGLKPFKCEICGKGFRIRKWVCAHKRRMHQTRELRYFCSFCNKGFTDKGPLQKHELRHKGIRPFVCMICGKGFGVKYVLEVHMQSVHSGEKKYDCEVCGKKFSLNQHYVTHMFKHRAQGEDIPGASNVQDTEEGQQG
ncbi:zinc finger protein 93 [Strongylocentrotus purpuratus]|uniref:Uncharacterized protein n=1 Tax=Strongylocentrotus purpuratus TaxID=7668 RepID=A0A7M7GJ32_STRPU|nr:zinc finger protein 93 [Strongylocentrotus purpuratus]|eukprot:XP_003731041.1 PREDICTED: zinc finger protein 93 [Strongylocentrotus purpuratus]